MQCPSCHEAAGSGLVCQACGAILPARLVDPFDALGVSPRFDVAPDELEGKFRELSRKLHPDRFARAGAKERTLSLQAATTLNDSYRKLKHPLRRAEALLARGGLAIAESDRVGPEFLLEMMELGEAIHDARDGNDAAALERALEDVRGRREAALAAMTAAFARGDALPEAKAQLIAIRYFDRLLEAGEPADGAARAAEGRL
jgi:molecular chaperone HscB